MNTLIAIGSLGILVLLLEVFGARKTIIPISVTGLIAILGLTLCTSNGETISHYNNMIVENSYSRGFSALFIILTAFLVAMSGDFYKKEPVKLSDFISIKLFLLFGGVAMVSFGNLATYFMGIEILSVSLYILAASNPKSLKSNEAGMKYFLMGAFASGFLLFGIALVYGAVGSFDINIIREAVSNETAVGWFYIGIIMISVAMFFKIAAVPFHLWAPDVYEGSPVLTTALMSTLAKVIAIAGFYKLIGNIYVNNFSEGFATGVIVISILSMTVGNIMALRQTNVKRMLAFSGISHAGFMLMALLAIPDGSNALLYYATAYALAGIAAFTVVISVCRDSENEDITNFNGLGKRHPVLAALLSLSLLSMAGIPVLAGFFAKVFLFNQMLNEGHITLVIFAVVNSIISIGYYFKLILAMYTKESDTQENNFPLVYTVVGVVAIILNLVIGLYPDVVLGLI